MQTRKSDRDTCHGSGVILTCYVNGRKRFKAVPLEDETSRDPQTEIGKQAARYGFGMHRDDRIH